MPELNGITVHPDCRHFRGDIPCRPNKEHGYQCANCPVYAPIEQRILIIKLGAIGDVIRTTPLLRRLRQEFPAAKITWLTLTPAILPAGEIDEVLKLDLPAVLHLQQREFDLLFNLDKDKEACALHDSIRAHQKFGYRLHPEYGVAWPSNALADHKFLTGVFNELSLQNQKPYVQEIFELCGFEFTGEEYVFDTHQDKGYDWSGLPTTGLRIGLNTGCGDRWTTRLWSDEKWVTLIGELQQAGYTPVLLGGLAEDERNQRLHAATGAAYLGTFPLEQFINLMYQMDAIVTQVTMAMHISIALRKPTILMNNIFNPYEFDLYGRGQLVQPDRQCVCFYRGTCKLGISCMEELPAEKVFAAVQASVPL
ncbi:glycosyltransferase family 9 protein [Hymenobacter taeanensis]|uniref:Glycosyltransferase family 9 protein n=1 Tax=Hymenobacter taeanensis TaxID=2735321 RepID=A0A6M6BCW5_9BACT|nr:MULTISPECIES: glycosyltransferase family 9 protein [Hymenobacter]QJX45594.1 glycosyltransferase family 9 protein [Hymenobacter taeanensis]UOQ81155.1 glycosyltransferase family 9 protein [Hymenobacter sp. 5414T-23]